VDLIAVVKANAYGHGAVEVVRRLRETGVARFAVATVGEAVEVRSAAADARVLVLTGCPPGCEAVFRRHDLIAAVFERRPPPPGIRAEVKIDTGMTRLGVPWGQAREFLSEVGDRIEGVFSQFASSDCDDDLSRLQLHRFLTATEGTTYPKHICNSGGLRFPEAHLNAVRVGLALYGVSPCPAVSDLEPVLSWKARILTIKDVPEGQAVGYGGTYTTQRSSRIGLLAVGYADGYSRWFSNRGQVRIRNRLAPVVGRVSMDLTAVDLTEIPSAAAGDEAILLENDPSSPISALRLAESLSSIPYEVFTSIGPRVERRYVP
jgi:alanine racemase